MSFFGSVARLCGEPTDARAKDLTDSGLAQAVNFTAGAVTLASIIETISMMQELS